MAKCQLSERTLKMKQNFIELHKQGSSIEEIAAKFDLTPGTVYRCLGEIATAAGVSRESLLQRPHSPHQGYSRRDDYQVFAKANLTDYQNHIQEILIKFDQTLTSIEYYIETQENFQSEEATPC